jgi:hypothetical protein
MCDPGKVKVKFTPEQSMKAQRGVEVKPCSFFNLCARWSWVVKAEPRPLYLQDRDTDTLYRRLGGPQGRAGRGAEYIAPTGFETRNVHPVACRYTE